MEKISALSTDFIQMAKSNGQRFDTNDFKSVAMQRTVQSLRAKIKEKGRINSDEQQELMVEFLRDLRNMTRSDIAAFDMRTAYDYFRREVDDEVKFREAIYSSLSQAISIGSLR